MKAKRGIPRYRKVIKRSGRYRSKFEKTTADYLRDNGITFKYESRSFDYVVQGRNWIICDKCGPIKGHIVRKYTPDFELSNEVFLETKGRFVAKDRSKMLAVKKQHPLLDVRMVFMRDNVITEGKSKLTYSEWCTKNEILWCVKDIPDEWLKKKVKRKVTYREAMGED
jgi:hypothetical protein